MDKQQQPSEPDYRAINVSGQSPLSTDDGDGLIKKVLLESGYITSDVVNKAEAYLRTHHISFLDYVLIQNLLSREVLGQAVAKYYDLPFADLEIYQPSKERISMIPADIGQAYRAVVFKIDDQTVTIATDNPRRAGLAETMANIFHGRQVGFAYALPDDIDSVQLYYRKPLVTRFAQIIHEQKRVAPEIIDEIIKDAVAYKVSDIHFEPQESIVVIRFRVDGVLHEAGQLQKKYYDNILNRVKVQAHMRIDEHLVAQDGAIRYEVDGEPVNIRISIIPTLDGEKVAMRLLAEYSRNLSIKNLGLSPHDRAIFDAQARRPFGMIITTGPTGSGKTTTLYSLLKLINNPEINITTIEDPVEYKIIGTNQIQVNNQGKMGFTEGLRSIVRQDPDVILVGEIRDSETAKLAVNAALTGHLLFSTFHANDASTAIPRLLDLGVEPFLVASTLNLVIAQRLVRTIHTACRVSQEVSIDQVKRLLPQAANYFGGPRITLYYGKGCEACNYTGFKGRTAIFELIVVDRDIQELILKNPSSGELWQLAAKKGAHTLFADGISKVQAGTTSLQELLRVAEPK
ncbi:Flp pilus assembly complex ATPase component TadA [Candidatus Saccharibacteria bacterium]|nr:Flp pilus assembly complex ATPase component TadA [Candidatus Saccharibacteria bacterium]